MRKYLSFLLLLLISLSFSGFRDSTTTDFSVDFSDPPTFSSSLLSPVPIPLCPGERVAISIMSVETSHNNMPVNGYAMNIIQSSPALGHLDPVSKVVVNGLTDFVYIAEDGAAHGTETDVLTFGIGGYPTGLVVPITIYGSCDYKLILLMEQHVLQDATYLNTVVNGNLTLKRATGQAHGEGTDDIYLDMGSDYGVFVCLLEPPIQGNGSMQADATFTPVMPGVETMSFDLIFEVVPLNNALLRCYDTGGDMNIQAEYPFEVGAWNPDEMGLQSLSMTLNHGSGSTEVSYKTLRGQVTVQREVHP